MPPRKKARLSQATSPSDSRTSPAPVTGGASPAKADDALLQDPWTDEEEIGLFKGLMRWKPTGIHKHFRLLALHAWLLDNHYIHPRNAHTRPAGIWQKLNTLYDLPALDVREDARQLPALHNPLARRDTDKKSGKGQRDQGEEEDEVDDDADVYSEAGNKIDEEEFELPLEHGFEQEMWNRRLPQNKSDVDENGDSEPEIPDLNMAPDPPIRFVPSFSIEPSETATPGSRKGRVGTAGTKKIAPRRSARQAESTADEEENVAEEEGWHEEEHESEDGEGEEEVDSVDEEASQASTPASKSTRTSRPPRGRGAGRRRGRGRGRR